MPILEQLREAVIADERSIRAIAASAGMDHSNLAKFLRGDKELGMSDAEKLVDALGLKLKGAKKRK